MAEAPLMKSRQKCLCSTIKLVKEPNRKCEMKISFVPGPGHPGDPEQASRGFSSFQANVQAADVQANVQANVQAAKLPTFPQHVFLDNR